MALKDVVPVPEAELPPEQREKLTKLRYEYPSATFAVFDHLGQNIAEFNFGKNTRGKTILVYYYWKHGDWDLHDCLELD